MRNNKQENAKGKNVHVFQYTYSAPQNDEVKKIRERYLPTEESKMDKLRRLDKSTTQKGLACSLMLGIVSSLILSIGMCCRILWDNSLLIPGVIIGLVGIAGVSIAYPLNSYLNKKERERLSPVILNLTNELLNGQA